MRDVYCEWHRKLRQAETTKQKVLLNTKPSWRPARGWTPYDVADTMEDISVVSIGFSVYVRSNYFN